MAKDNGGNGNRPRRLSQGFLDHRWKPGESGNPKGRPKRPSFEAIVSSILDEQVTVMLDGQPLTKSKRELVARVFVDEMLKRNGKLLREFLLRVWPAVQKIEFPDGIEVRQVDVETGDERLEEVLEILDDTGAIH